MKLYVDANQEKTEDSK